MSAHSNLPHSSTTEHWQSDPDAVPDFDTPRLQRIISVIDTDAINVIFDPPIACVMRDPDGRQREMRLGDTDALVALVFAGWQMVEVVA